mmetsp:Transcript_118516/g.335237  ORF Transcript_118516/g.335237 Transcript_118516/m.335237 type:complete len:213 (-) Transcript_118516:1433-2071(-)
MAQEALQSKSVHEPRGFVLAGWRPSRPGNAGLQCGRWRGRRGHHHRRRRRRGVCGTRGGHSGRGRGDAHPRAQAIQAGRIDAYVQSHADGTRAHRGPLLARWRWRHEFGRALGPLPAQGHRRCFRSAAQTQTGSSDAHPGAARDRQDHCGFARHQSVAREGRDFEGPCHRFFERCDRQYCARLAEAKPRPHLARGQGTNRTLERPASGLPES